MNVEQADQLDQRARELGSKLGDEITAAMDKEEHTADALVLFTHALAEVVGNIGVTVCTAGRTPRPDEALDSFVEISMRQITANVALWQPTKRSALRALLAEQKKEGKES